MVMILILKYTIKQLPITDVYYDLSDKTLHINKISLRVRIEEIEKE